MDALEKIKVLAQLAPVVVSHDDADKTWHFEMDETDYSVECAAESLEKVVEFATEDVVQYVNDLISNSFDEYLELDIDEKESFIQRFINEAQPLFESIGFYNLPRARYYEESEVRDILGLEQVSDISLASQDYVDEMAESHHEEMREDTFGQKC